MSINAYIENDVALLDDQYKASMDKWAKENGWTIEDNKYAYDNDCSYLDSAFDGIIEMLKTIPAPVDKWVATTTWSAEEGATVDGNTVNIYIENGEIAKFETSRIVFDIQQPWDYLVDAAKQLTEKEPDERETKLEEFMRYMGDDNDYKWNRLKPHSGNDEISPDEARNSIKAFFEYCDTGQVTVTDSEDL